MKAIYIIPQDIIAKIRTRKKVVFSDNLLLYVWRWTCEVMFFRTQEVGNSEDVIYMLSLFHSVMRRERSVLFTQSRALFLYLATLSS